MISSSDLRIFGSLNRNASYVPDAWFESGWLYSSDHLAVEAIIFWGAIKAASKEKQLMYTAGFRAILRTVNPLISEDEICGLLNRLRHLEPSALSQAKEIVQTFLNVYNERKR